MSKREDTAIIQDMKEAIMSYTSGIEYDGFRQDYKTQDAVMRNIEILGEAAKLLSGETNDNIHSVINQIRICHSRRSGNPEKHWIPGQARNDRQS